MAKGKSCWSPGKIVLAAIVYLVIAQVIHIISTVATMDYYFMPQYFPVWSKLMMPTAGPPPASFYYYSIAFSFIAGIMFSAAYYVLKQGIPGKHYIQKGLNYGLLVFAVAGIPFALTNFLLINLPTLLVLTWAFLDGLVAYVLAGVAVARVLE
jgi:hypothetical protein